MELFWSLFLHFLALLFGTFLIIPFVRIRKSELIDLYDKLGYSYFDMTMDDLDDELNTFRELKKKEAAV